MLWELHWSQWQGGQRARILPATSHSTGRGSGVPESSGVGGGSRTGERSREVWLDEI